MITIDWAAFVIHVPRADLTLVQTTPLEIRELDINWFRLQLKAIEESEAGVSYPDTHIHNTEVNLGGITYARVIAILDPYSITFEDGQYAINLIGANSNIGDKVNVNQVSIRANNSAGLTSSPTIEYSSFNSGVMVDVTTTNVGTAFPRGTEQMPINNMDDALLIAAYRGFNKLYIKTNIVLAENYRLSNFLLVGSSHMTTMIMIESQAIIDGVSISNCDISGVMDSMTMIEGCTVGNLEFMNGQIHNSTLRGNILLGGGIDALIENCSQSAIYTTPVIDMGISGQNLVATNYSGILKFINFSGASNSIDIGLSAGHIILDSASIKAGSIIASGVGRLIDENGNRIQSGIWNGAVNIQNDLINKNMISDAVWDEVLINHTITGTAGGVLSLRQFDGIVWISQISGVSGVTFPIGSQGYPVNNIQDASQIANGEGIKVFRIDGNIIITTDLERFAIGGNSFLDDSLTFNNNIYNKIAFSTLHLDGIASFDNCEFIGCYVENFENFSGEAIGCKIGNNISIAAGKTFSGTEIVIEGDNTIIDLQNQPCTVSLDINSGKITFINAVVGCLIELNLKGGEIILDDSCVGGNFYVEGIGMLYNNSAMTVLHNYLLAPEPIADYVWNKTL